MLNIHIFAGNNVLFNKCRLQYTCIVVLVHANAEYSCKTTSNLLMMGCIYVSPYQYQTCVLHLMSYTCTSPVKDSGGSKNGAIGGGPGGWLEGRPGAGPTHSPARGYGGAL